MRLDAPEIECISKSKAHKRYEFGCKVSLSLTNKANWITSIAAVHGNPFDGHTLNKTISRSENVSGVKVKEVYVDPAYRGHDYVGDAQVYKQGGTLRALKVKMWPLRCSENRQGNDGEADILKYSDAAGSSFGDLQ